MGLTMIFHTLLTCGIYCKLQQHIQDTKTSMTCITCKRICDENVIFGVCQTFQTFIFFLLYACIRRMCFFKPKFQAKKCDLYAEIYGTCKSNISKHFYIILIDYNYNMLNEKRNAAIKLEVKQKS